MSYTKDMQLVVKRYRAAEQTWPASSKEMASWAIKNGLWEISDTDIINTCAKDLARAMREEYATDEKGRRVRQKHPAKKFVDGKQITIWDDLATASHNHMQLAFQQRRRAIVADCVQLKIDVDGYNDREDRPEQIEMVFNFTYDVEEALLGDQAA